MTRVRFDGWGRESEAVVSTSIDGLAHTTIVRWPCGHEEVYVLTLRQVMDRRTPHDALNVCKACLCASLGEVHE